MKEFCTQGNSLNYLLHKNLSHLVQFPKEGVFTHVLLRSPCCTYTLFGLAADNYIQFHNSTGNISIQVIQGSGALELLEGEVEIEAGAFLFIPSHITQGLYASTDLALLHCLTHDGNPNHLKYSQEVDKHNLLNENWDRAQEC